MVNEFLSWHKRMKISGNYTAVYTHNLPKNVGQKPGHRKAPSQCKKPDIATHIDPFSFDSMTVQPNQFAHTSCQKTDSLLTTYTTITPLITAHQFQSTSKCVDSQPTLPVCMTNSTGTQQHCNANTRLGSCVFTVAQTTSTSAVATSQSMLTSCQMDSHVGTQNNTTINNVIATALAQLFQCNQAGSTNQIGQFSLNPSSPLLNLQAQHSSSSPVVTSNCPFEVKFPTPAIKICAGCRKGYTQAPDGKGCLPPPNDLCLVHKEQHLYYNIVNVRQQLSSLSNVHYHANITCPKIRFPSFDPHAV